MELREPILRALEVDSGSIPEALGVEDAVEQPRLPSGVAAGANRLEDLPGPLHTDGKGGRNAQHMSAKAVAVDEDSGGILLVVVHTLGDLDLQLLLAEAGPPGAVDGDHRLAVKGISEHYCQAITLIVVVVDEALGPGPEAHLQGHSRRRFWQILQIGQVFRNKNVASGMQSGTLQPRIPSGDTRLLEEAQIPLIIPVFNLAILSLLEFARQLSLVH